MGDGTAHDAWGLREGDAITSELTAVRRLGGGSAYEAYLAFDEITYAPVVVKLVRPDQVDDEHARRGLAREVEALAVVNHPVVVRALRHRLDGARPHVVLEHLDGPRLSSLLRRYGALPPQQYLPLAIELASALHYLRHVGWVHLDVKPSNVIMGAPARLIDLSVARPLAEAAHAHRVGTDAYLAPEQCDPEGAPGHASDVWGLGATLFEAVAGRRPFRPVDDAYPQLSDDPAALPDDVPHEVVKVVGACLERDPAHRSLPHEVAEALEPVLARQPRAVLGGALKAR